MVKRLKRVSLIKVEGQNFIAKDLYMADPELENIERKLEFPSSKRKIKEYSELGVFNNPNKFQISSLSEESHYFFLGKLFNIDYSKKENKLESLDDIGADDSQNHKFSPDMIAYYFQEENNKFIYLIELKMKSFLIQDKVIMGLLRNEKKKKSGTEDRIEAEVIEVTKGIDFPLSGFLCEIRQSTDANYGITVFNSGALDSVLKLESKIQECANHTLTRFNEAKDTNFYLAQKSIQVEIVNQDRVMSVVKGNIKLSKALSFYTGHQNRKINKIPKEELKQAIQRLKDHIDDEGNKYELHEIPDYDEQNNKIKVDEYQIKIFTALLDNKIVERILDKSIDLPFFD